jgi:hypothetical protein
LDTGGSGFCGIEDLVLKAWAIGESLEWFCSSEALGDGAVGEAKELNERGLRIANAFDGTEPGVVEGYVSHDINAVTRSNTSCEHL